MNKLNRNFSITRKLGLVDTVIKNFCGPEKPYRSLVIIFDEFGKYIEFATMKSQIAGSGVLQELFEAVQSSNNRACFIGFIQFELNAYLQRIAPEFKNEMLRYITRYQAADKLYLSINLETLIASLLEKKQEKKLLDTFEGPEAFESSMKVRNNITEWFPHSQNYRTWVDEELFHTVIRIGCWPLSPYSAWLLFYMASAGKYLQERSVLALLGNSFNLFEDKDVEDVATWSITPIDLWSDDLQQELLSSEEFGQQGSIAHSFASVLAKHGTRLSKEQIDLLRAVVLSSKLGLCVTGKDEAIQALSSFTSMRESDAIREIEVLQEEYNVIEWDDAFKAFDILGDAIPRTQFLAYVRQHVAAAYDEAGKSRLFASKASEWCELLDDISCDFAEENKLSTREWKYLSVTSNLEFLPQQLKLATDRWMSAVGVDEPRGTVIYTYVEQSRSLGDVLEDIRQLLRVVAKELKVKGIPILVVVLYDYDGHWGQVLAEYAVLEEMNDTERARFGSLVNAHKEKVSRAIRERADSLIKNRQYMTPFGDVVKARRLSQVGTDLFKEIYTKPIPFPFDGFSTARGNAADTCLELTLELMHGKLDYEGVIAKPVKIKNRALKVLKDTWGIFNKNGSVSRRPEHPTIRGITEKLDDELKKKQKLSMASIASELLHPPFGGNLASLGLLLGVYLTPRCENLVVLKEGQQMSISQWVQEGVFKGKFIDLALLNAVDLAALGEGASEWDSLLDEWEQCTSYLSMVEYLKRAMKLKTRIPIPPKLLYKKESLRRSAVEAGQSLEEMKKAQDNAWGKLEKSLEKKTCSLAAWAAVDFKKLFDKMADEDERWTNDQLVDVENDYAKARQYAAHFFSDWLKNQTPKSDNPTSVGDFKHRMIKVVGANLKKIGLEKEFALLEKHTMLAISNAETIADAKQVLREAQSWLSSNGDPSRVDRIAEIRDLKKTAAEHSEKLQKLIPKIGLSEFEQSLSKLSELTKALKEREKALSDRAYNLWNTRIRTDKDLDWISRELDSLIYAFENIPSDLEDLQQMKEAMKMYCECHERLSDNNLSWANFKNIGEEIRLNYTKKIDEERVPWKVNEVVDAFVHNITHVREKKSEEWVERIQELSASIEKMAVQEANRLYTELEHPPAVLTKAHAELLENIKRKLDRHLTELSFEWLVEKFKGLPQDKKLDFIRMAQEIAEKM